MAALSAQRAQFYLQAYPRLLHQLDLLVEAVRRDDPNIAAIVFFGAAVRLHPHPTTSANLLFLARDVDVFLAASPRPTADAPPTMGCTGVQLVRSLQRVPGDGWQLSGVVSDLAGEDLGPAMLDHIARQGLLVYADEATVLPKPLRGLRDVATWRGRVYTLLARCRNVLADDTPLGRQKLRARRNEGRMARSVVWDLDLRESIAPEPRA